MKGDFSRDTFEPAKDYTRVLMQQGRVLLDADWNEQAALFHHYLRNFIKDLLGPYAGPKDKTGFAIEVGGKSLKFCSGKYYVDGICCECRRGGDASSDVTWFPIEDQPGYPFAGSVALKEGNEYLVYLDVWERHVTYLEDEALREVALNGADTATRARSVWQVKISDQWQDIPSQDGSRSKVHERWSEWVELWQGSKRYTLTAYATPTNDRYTNPCMSLPQAGYRGTENQLYRVEIHRGGQIGEASFKWSRDNGSTVFPIDVEKPIEISLISSSRNSSTKQMTAVLALTGRDELSRLNKWDWVELVDETLNLRGAAEPLWQVLDIDVHSGQVKLSSSSPNGAPDENGTITGLKRPFLRLWHQAGGNVVDEPEDPSFGTVPIKENDRFDLEDGISIRFSINRLPFRTGDYWLIPARAATGDIIWPRDQDGNPKARPPAGPEHHYAPLAIVDFKQNPPGVVDCRKWVDLAIKDCGPPP